MYVSIVCVDSINFTAAIVTVLLNTSFSTVRSENSQKHNRLLLMNNCFYLQKRAGRGHFVCVRADPWLYPL